MKARDLSKLSIEDKLKLYDLIQEKKKRIKQRRAAYKPNKGQLPIHLSDKTIKFCASGNGAGKTCASVHEAIWAAQGYHPIKKRYTKVPAQIAVVLDKPNKADDVWIPEITKFFDTDDWTFSKKGKANITEISFPNGSVITFYSHDQEPLTFESIQIDCAVMDEPPPRKIFIALRRGGRKLGTEPWFLIVGTPLAQSWLRIEIYNPWSKGELEEADCFKMSSDTNKENINWKAQEQSFAFMTEKERAVRRHGDFFDLSGQALAPYFDRDTHIIPTKGFHWPEENPCVLSIDPHGSKPHVAIIMGVDSDNQLTVLNEFSRSCSPREYALHMKKFMEPYKIIDIIVDSYGNSSSNGLNHIEAAGYTSFIKTLNDNGVRARATTYKDKDDEDFVTRIQSSLVIPYEDDNLGRRLPKMRLLDRCTGCIMDIENVQWQRDRKTDENKPKLDIQHSDHLACIKYALATNLFYDKAKRKTHYKPRPVSYGGRASRTPIISADDWLKD